LSLTVGKNWSDQPGMKSGMSIHVTPVAQTRDCFGMIHCHADSTTCLMHLIIPKTIDFATSIQSCQHSNLQRNLLSTSSTRGMNIPLSSYATSGQWGMQWRHCRSGDSAASLT
jgi:hypothetical protein